MLLLLAVMLCAAGAAAPAAAGRLHGGSGQQDAERGPGREEVPRGRGRGRGRGSAVVQTGCRGAVRDEVKEA